MKIIYVILMGLFCSLSASEHYEAAAAMASFLTELRVPDAAAVAIFTGITQDTAIENALSKMFQCQYCGKFFTSQGNLTNHKRTHTGEKPFACDICEKSFSQKGNLTIHIRTHTGEKPYKCDFCEKYFSVNGTLTRHQRTHTGEKPYICEYCGKCFTNTGHLKTHVRTHIR